MIATVVLAAGRGSRFGADKLAAVVAGRSLLDWTLLAVSRHAGGGPVVVVASAPGGAATVVAERAGKGMNHSLVAGLNSLGDDITGAVVVLGDDPLAALALGRILVVASSLEPDSVIAVRRDAPVPHPVFLPRRVWPADADGDRGLRHLVDAEGTVWVSGEGLPEPIDVDIPADLERLAPLLRSVPV